MRVSRTRSWLIIRFVSPLSRLVKTDRLVTKGLSQLKECLLSKQTPALGPCPCPYYNTHTQLSQAPIQSSHWHCVDQPGDRSVRKPNPRCRVPFSWHERLQDVRSCLQWPPCRHFGPPFPWGRSSVYRSVCSGVFWCAGVVFEVKSYTTDLVRVCGCVRGCFSCWH